MEKQYDGIMDFWLTREDLLILAASASLFVFSIALLFSGMTNINIEEQTMYDEYFPVTP